MSDEDLIASVTTSVTTDPVVSDDEDDVEPPLTSSYHWQPSTWNAGWSSAVADVKRQQLHIISPAALDFPFSHRVRCKGKKPSAFTDFFKAVSVAELGWHWILVTLWYWLKDYRVVCCACLVYRSYKINDFWKLKKKMNKKISVRPSFITNLSL